MNLTLPSVEGVSISLNALLVARVFASPAQLLAQVSTYIYGISLPAIRDTTVISVTAMSLRCPAQLLPCVFAWPAQLLPRVPLRRTMTY